MLGLSLGSFPLGGAVIAFDTAVRIEFFTTFSFSSRQAGITLSAHRATFKLN